MNVVIATPRRDLKRDMILSIAQEVFLEEGYAAASMSTIAARLGGSKGTLYNYFRSKAELFVAVIQNLCEVNQNQIFDVADQDIRKFLTELGHEVQDFGTTSSQAVDYPLFIRPVAEAVARGQCERGIVLGGSGNGEAIVANRVSGIRCALCWNLESARLAREHNDANMLSLGQRMMSLDMALEIVRTWLETPFEGGRHQRRIDLIDAA